MYGRLDPEQFEYYLAPLKERWKQAYPASVVNRCYLHVKDLPPITVQRMIDSMLDTFRYAPLPKDFMEAARIERNKNNNFSYGGSEEAEPRKILCSDCGDTGLIEVKEKNYDYPSQVRMFCHCEAGKKSEGSHNLPRWDNSYSQGYRIVPNSETRGQWRPTPQIGFWELVEVWKEKTKISEQYWQHQMGETVEGEI